MIKTRLKGMIIAVLVGGVFVGGLMGLAFGVWQQEIVVVLSMASVMFYLIFNKSHLIEGKDGIYRSSQDDNLFCGIISFFSFLVLSWPLERITIGKLAFINYFAGGIIVGYCFFLVRKISGYRDSDL